MTLQELEHLSIADIDLILQDQIELYSPEELNELREWRAHLAELKGISSPPSNPNPPTAVRCPKCDGWNAPDAKACVYCSHKLTKEIQHSDSSSNHPAARRLFVGILLIISGLFSTCYGIDMNNSYEAQWDAFWGSGNFDPGTTWIVVGAVGLILGLICVTSALIKSE